MTTPFWRRRDWAAFLLTTGIALVVYTLSLPPSITMEDAGELAVAADYLGVPHPPGYPIWTFFAWFFQWILHPLEYRGYANPAWAIAFMSAVFGSLACGFVSMIISRFTAELATVPSAEPPSWTRTLIPRAAGAGWGLLTALFLQQASKLGVPLLNLTLFLFAVTCILRGLTPPEGLIGFRGRIPSLSSLGEGALGFLLAGLSYSIFWTRLIIPSAGTVLLSALGGVVLLLGLAAVAGQLTTSVLSHRGLAADVSFGRVDLVLGVGGGLLLAFTPLLWSQSVIIEVYSLNAFFVSILLWLMYRYIHRPDNRTLYTAGFLFALGLTNHQSLLFLIFFLVAAVAAAGQRNLLKDGLMLMGLSAVGFFILKAVQYQRLEDLEATRYFLLCAIPAVLLVIALVMTGGGLFRAWRQIGVLLFLGFLGLSFHFFMPVASEQNPPMNWGYARTPEGFKHALTRGQYASFSVADNYRKIGRTMGTAVKSEWLEEGRERDLARGYAQRTLFPRQLGAFFHDPGWKTSIANQFSWQRSTEPVSDDPLAPAPPERTIPFALIGLLPLLCFPRFGGRRTGWFLATLIAMFFVTVVFLIIQWPQLDLNDLWVKRVQYIQAHVLYALWMSTGAILLVFLIRRILPFRWTAAITALLISAGFVAFPLHKEISDPRHADIMGSSSLRGHDYGWDYGFHQLKGANGILLDELAHHDNPDTMIDDRAVTYLRTVGTDEDLIQTLREQAGNERRSLDQFNKEILDPLSLDPAGKRAIRQAAMLSGFRSLSPEEQAARLVTLHRPLPDWDYPAEMDPGAILFGGTDPGRFVPTYMVFSAGVRPDVFVVTQNALADPTYLDSMRDLYGDDILIPDVIDSNRAFLDYADQLRITRGDEFAGLVGSGTMAVSGAHEVNKINALLARRMFEANKKRHAHYFEEAFAMPWMDPYLRPHGLIFKLEPEPVNLTLTDIRKDFEFWDWMLEHLLETHRPKSERSGRFQRDLQARKTYSKLRLSHARNYFERGRWPEARRALRQSIRLYPANPETASRGARMYIKMRQFDRAEEMLDRLEAHDPTHQSLPLLRQQVSYRRELNENRRILETDHQHRITGNTTLQLVITYSYLDMEAPMREAAELLIRLPSLQPEYYAELYKTMRAHGDPDYARKALREWMKRDPSAYRPHIELAVMDLSNQAYAEAFSSLVHAVQLAPAEARQAIASDPRFIDIHHWSQFQSLIFTKRQP